ncbi:MAG: lysophospholipid acyltransferase family protein [Pseudomonadota bacterium]
MTQPTWHGDIPERRRIGPLGWALVLLRGVPLALLLSGGLLLLLLIRQVERPIHGLQRPWTPWITQGVCRTAFKLLGMRYRTQGKRMAHPGAVVANHSSWLDIFALNARKRVYFVSKAEVAGWIGIGWLARATGTIFIERSARQARAQKELFEARLAARHKLLFFPEGTSSDGQRVLPFKSTIFAAFFADSLKDQAWIQPVTVHYTAPKDADTRFYGWFGDMSFGEHAIQVLAASPQGGVDVIYHEPVPVSDFADRKSLAAHCEAVVRSGFPEGAVQPV